MRIAILGDFHGNIHGLEAVLEDVETHKPDQIICMGDLISPMPGSIETWDRIQELGIPLIRGNHEDYIVAAHDGADESLPKRSVRFMPVRYAANLFSPNTIEQIASLPLSITLTASDGSEAMVCHASPLSNAQSYASGIDAKMANALRGVSARTLVSGHLHKPWHREWEDKQLYLVGSGGFPIRGMQPDLVEYGLLEFNAGQWQVHNKKVRYDYQSALQYVLDSSFLDESGPIGWLFFLEMVTQVSHIMTLFKTSNFDPWPDEEDFSAWEDAVIRYLKRVDLWDTLQDYLVNR